MDLGDDRRAEGVVPHEPRALLPGEHAGALYELHRSARQPHVFTPPFAAWYSVVLPALLSGATTFFRSTWDPGRTSG
nr:hypothetical protein [Halobellus ruber]